ncbi:20804_t:CDS:2 [Cetraspora pellucida]|uniref:20804_t:CDS:1 n=1 Tax=Cetraspora pellucida TaxID=1433469 RepID=A0A9N8W721_9GLOM|nr:20804_t:CDS:2 [Cetraspora pellucida]
MSQVKLYIWVHNITVLDWVPQSPNLNTIEQLWDYVDCQVRERKPLPLD